MSGSLLVADKVRQKLAMGDYPLEATAGLIRAATDSPAELTRNAAGLAVQKPWSDGVRW